MQPVLISKPISFRISRPGSFPKALSKFKEWDGLQLFSSLKVHSVMVLSTGSHAGAMWRAFLSLSAQNGNVIPNASES